MGSKKAEKKKYKKQRKKNKRIYRICSFIAIPLIIVSIYLFKKTFVSFSTIGLIFVSSGFIGLYFDHKKYFFTYKLKNWTGYVSGVIFYAFFLGATISSLLLSSNFFLSVGTVTTKDYKIISRNSVSGSKYRRGERKPVFSIRFNEQEKVFEYPHKFYKDMDLYKSIYLKTRKGFLGYDIILEESLKK